MTNPRNSDEEALAQHRRNQAVLSVYAERDAALVEVERLQRAIAEHRTAITNAGTIRVDDRDASIAEHKHKLDQWLWAMIQPADPERSK